MPTPRPSPRLLLRLIALCGSLLLALLLGEVSVRLLGADSPKPDLGIAPHPRWHHWHRPNYSFDYLIAAEGYTQPVRFNAHGMRDSREITLTKPAGVRRIAVVGDSFVEAMQVGEREGVVRRLEAHLQGAGPVEVLNFGCSGFSTTLELVLVRESVRQFAPDLVVCLHHFSDMSEDWSFAPRAVRSAGSVAAVTGADNEGERALRGALEHSQLFRVARGAHDARRRHHAPDRDASLKQTFDAVVHDPYSADDDEAWEYSLAALGEMGKLLAAEGVPLLVVVIPIGTQVEPVDADFARSLGFQYLAAGQRLEHRGYQDRVTGYCRKQNIACLDLLDDFRAANQEGKPLLYLPRDQHWSAAGHDRAARRIAGEITQRHLLR